jgi:hypothetical protein
MYVYAYIIVARYVKLDPGESVLLNEVGVNSGL